MISIESFSGDYFFLSNFAFSPIMWGSYEYRTVEHAFQAAKTNDPLSQSLIRQAPTPQAAKSLGRRVELRLNWEESKVPVMYDLLRRKFDRKEQRALLEATDDALLVEGNTWGDRIWGVSGSVGHNMLGRLLMLVREENRL